MKRTGVRRRMAAAMTGVLAAGMAFAAVTALPAQANDDLDKYAGDKKDVKVETSRSFTNNQTTFTFVLSTKDNVNVSHVILMACPGVSIVSASGPDGPASSLEPKQDSAIKDSGHEGIKFDPGKPGTYTIVFAGNILGAEFVVKDGDGHQHFRHGAQADLCKTASEQTPNNPPANNPPANNPPADNPSSNPASNQPGQPGTQVQGATQTKPAAPSTDVLGAQQSQPEIQGATLPRTGAELGLLGQMGAMFVAFGSVALAAGRRRRV